MLILIALKRLQHGVIVGGDWTRLTFATHLAPSPRSEGQIQCSTGTYNLLVVLRF
jgi:hypothetical protein